MYFRQRVIYLRASSMLIFLPVLSTCLLQIPWG